MQIGGFQAFTLSDYPAHIAAVIFVQGCNFRCPFCHNASLIPMNSTEHNLVPEQDIIQFLSDRSNQLDGLVITGGEPTLQSDLIDFIKKCKELGYHVKLDTNGSRPDVIDKLLKDDLVDYIAMDIKAPSDKYSALSGCSTSFDQLQKSIELISQNGIMHEFRTTVVESLLSKDDIKEIENLVPDGSAHRLQSFNPEHTLEPSLTH